MLIVSLDSAIGSGCANTTKVEVPASFNNLDQLLSLSISAALADKSVDIFVNTYDCMANGTRDSIRSS
jgi:hypothetical protein